MKRILTTAALSLSLCGINTIAHAGVLNRIELPENANVANLVIDGVGVSVAADGGMFMSKTVGGHTGTGISGGSVPGEIAHTQQMHFTFSEPVFITSLTIAHLYIAEEFGDHWNEVARFDTNAGSFQLEATGATTADWNGFGEVHDVSPALQGHGGAWTILGDDIFGGAITSLTLMSGNPGWLARYADFGFVEFTFNAVPSPGAVALLGLAGLIGSRRRR